MAGCQYGFEQTVIAGTVPRLPDLVHPDDDRRSLAAIGIIAYMALDITERKLCPWKK